MWKSKITLTLGMLLLVLIPIVIFAVVSVKPGKPGQYDQLATCLTEKGAKMYGAYWCAHCQAQKKAFGTAFEKINYIECALPGGKGQTEECKQAGIENYPTWEFADGERLAGEVSLEQLATKAQCAIGGEN